MAKTTQHAARGTRNAVAAVLFDFEGTLVDFQWRLEEAEAALRAALAELAFDLSLFAGDNYAMLRTRALQLASTASVKAEVERRFAELYDRYDEDALSRWRPRPGASELLDRLSRGGVRLGLVTNIGRRAIDAALPRVGLGGFFGAVVTRNDVRLAKPSGEGIRKALRMLRCVPEEALFVGDSLSDVGAARDAGVRVALVAGGEPPAPELEARPPDHSLTGLHRVPDLLPRLPA
ncbi:MAG: HAD family hydrolase [Deltaproteobacteria bacterium]|nr:HAD family hydrolase [Deltaproteobacteria bacterium]